MTDATQETAPIDEAAEMSALYQSLTKDGIEDDEDDAGGIPEAEPDETINLNEGRDENGRFKAKAEPEAEEAEPEAAEVEEPEAETEEDEPAPSYLPHTLKEQWADVPENLRQPIAEAHLRMSQKLTEAGNRDRAISPIYDAVVKAAHDLPVMKDMKPEDIASSAFELARIQARLKSGPEEATRTIAEIAQRYGAVDGLRKMLGGQAPQGQPQAQPDAMRHIAALEQKIAELSDPARLQQMIDERFTAQTVSSHIDQFAETAEHWNTVLPGPEGITLAEKLPRFIEIAESLLDADADDAEVLAEAYDMAVKAFGLKVQPEKRADPERAKAAKSAKAINVRPSEAGSAKPLTEMEQMRQTYRKLMAD